MFVLTGATPAVPALKVGISVQSSTELYGAKTPSSQFIDARVIIEASPWLCLETVKKGYRKAQTELTGTSGGKPPSQKNLRLFRFVTERVEPTSTGGYARMPKGKTLVSEWNETYPEWAYKTSVGDLDTRRFWRDYNRIRRTIAVGPPYRTRNHGATVQ